MRCKAGIIVGLTGFVVLMFALGLHVSRGSAETPPPGPDRVAAMYVDYTSYTWWMVLWQDNEVVCAFSTDHEGLPNEDEIYTGCGEELFDKWVVTEACASLETGGAASSCLGYYLHFVESNPARRKIGVTLPQPVVWVSLEGCTPLAPANYCEGQPKLVLTGDEPLPNEKIIRIEGTLNGEAFACNSAVCKLALEATGEIVMLDGKKVYVGEAPAVVDFWAYSSYGDSSPPFDAQVLVADNENDLVKPGWYVNVLSTQWNGTQVGCSQTWKAFPPLTDLPTWLSTPDKAEDLASNIPYDYLAGHLIRQGVVDVSDCLDDGLMPGGAANACGRERAREAVEEWQNSFDQMIFKAAKDSGVPAQLLKNLFSRESQFWPGIIDSVSEVGLGQLTDNGADTTLLWNPSFFEQFCPLVLVDSVCRKRYPQLQPDEQALLRGALMRRVDTYCADCPLGIDLRQADFSISVFAETLRANCEQVGQIIQNYLWNVPGEVSGYEDLWKFTLVNYNAGPGCLSIAIEETVDADEPLDWEHISTHLTPICEGARDYVEDISQ